MTFIDTAMIVLVVLVGEISLIVAITAIRSIKPERKPVTLPSIAIESPRGTIHGGGDGMIKPMGSIPPPFADIQGSHHRTRWGGME